MPLPWGSHQQCVIESGKYGSLYETKYNYHLIVKLPGPSRISISQTLVNTLSSAHIVVSVSAWGQQYLFPTINRGSVRTLPQARYVLGKRLIPHNPSPFHIVVGVFGNTICVQNLAVTPAPPEYKHMVVNRHHAG
jgi:hypothetical protein